MVSVGLRPKIVAADAWLLGAATALAVLEACRARLPRSLHDELALKWPNDVVDERGRKLAGLLLETAISDDRVSEAVLGVGINVNWARAEMPAELVERATSLIDLGSRRVADGSGGERFGRRSTRPRAGARDRERWVARGRDPERHRRHRVRRGGPRRG